MIFCFLLISGRVSGTVYEIVTEDEYLPLRMESMDGFAAEVRNAYIKILKDIKEKCCHENVFIFPQANRLADEIYKKTGLSRLSHEQKELDQHFIERYGAG